MLISFVLSNFEEKMLHMCLDAFLIGLFCFIAAIVLVTILNIFIGLGGGKYGK